MALFTITAHTLRPTDAAQSRITDLLLGENGALYSTTRFDGQITAWDIDGTAPAPLDSRNFASGVIAGNQPMLASVMTDTGPALLSGGAAGGTWTLHDLSTDGRFGAETDLGTSLTGPLIQPASVTLESGATRVYAAQDGQRGVIQIDLGPTGTLTGLTSQHDTNRTAAGDITALTSATVGATIYLIGASTAEAGITAWRVNANGSLSDTDTLWAADGLRMSTPTALESVSIAGETYVILADATADSLTVLHLDAAGDLQITDNVLDDRSTRFEGVTALATTTHDGIAWVFAGGSDDGISAFQVLEGGRLLHRATIADTTDSTLANISALGVRSETIGIAVFAASATEAGLTELMLAIDPADEVILDTAGSDVLTGGAGADVFVFGKDGAADTITDFTIGEDRVDLGAWDGLRSKSQLTFDATTDGLRITYGDETLRLQSADGTTINADALSEADLIGQTTLALTLEAGQSGPVTATPALPERYIPAAGTPAPDAPVERVEDYGTAGSDEIMGGMGADLLFGQTGQDHLQGSAGDDLLFGGLGRDRLDGGTDDDQLFGGEGRDMGWTTPQTPVQSLNGDVLNGGTGDDRLYGQAGRDRLDGGEGDDMLMGGAGRDTFVFRSGHDTVGDFDPLIDTLDLDADLWGGKLSAVEVVDQFASTDNGDLVLTFDADNSLRLSGFDEAAALADQITFL